MKYEYINDDSGEIIERDFPMTGEIPQKVEHEGKEYRRNYRAGFVIPEHMKATGGITTNRFNYEKKGKHVF